MLGVYDNGRMSNWCPIHPLSAWNTTNAAAIVEVKLATDRKSVNFIVNGFDMVPLQLNSSIQLSDWFPAIYFARQIAHYEVSFCDL